MKENLNNSKEMEEVFNTIKMVTLMKENGCLTKELEKERLFLQVNLVCLILI